MVHRRESSTSTSEESLWGLEQVCRSLPDFHAFTGCDTVSTFDGRGKVAGYRIVKRNADRISSDVPTSAGMAWNMSDHLYHSLQKLTCAICMYCNNPGIGDITQWAAISTVLFEERRRWFQPASTLHWYAVQTPATNKLPGCCLETKFTKMPRHPITSGIWLV